MSTRLAYDAPRTLDNASTTSGPDVLFVGTRVKGEDATHPSQAATVATYSMENLAMNIDSITTAELAADVLIADLQEAASHNSAVASQLMLPMIQRAAALKSDIATLRQAVRIDATEAKGGAT